ncbi:MAG: family 10 glycosylhydrolase, partial [Anaerovoracaceae bacterium]|nr:family 10 glycosylhydrolase [Anaerovoracaceae bacterium]
MKKRGIFAVCAAFAVLVLTVLGGFAVNAFAADNDKGDRLRGVWVATVYRLDYPKTASTDEAVLKRQADEILDGAASMGLNAVFFQVRPGSDAFYDSKIYPWSQYLTGTQGTAPENGFDPLEYWTEGAHARGMELHAWINPYRITKNGDSEYASLAE